MISEVRKQYYHISITNVVDIDTCRDLGEKNPSAGFILLTAEDNGSGDAKGQLGF